MAAERADCCEQVAHVAPHVRKQERDHLGRKPESLLVGVSGEGRRLVRIGERLELGETTDRLLFLEPREIVVMPKSKPTKAKQERKKVDLVDRYQKIGISAVAAALRCQKEKRPDDMSARGNRSRSGPVNVRSSFLDR